MLGDTCCRLDASQGWSETMMYSMTISRSEAGPAAVTRPEIGTMVSAGGPITSDLLLCCFDPTPPSTPVTLFGFEPGAAAFCAECSGTEGPPPCPPPEYRERERIHDSYICGAASVFR